MNRICTPFAKAMQELLETVLTQGSGRSLWFVCCADARRASVTIAQFDEPRRPDLWSCIGPACAYARGCTEGDVDEVCAAAGRYSGGLALAPAFAAKARLRAGNLAPDTERIYAVFCRIPAREAAAITDSELKNLPGDWTGTGIRTLAPPDPAPICRSPEVNREHDTSGAPPPYGGSGGYRPSCRHLCIRSLAGNATFRASRTGVALQVYEACDAGNSRISTSGRA